MSQLTELTTTPGSPVAPVENHDYRALLASLHQRKWLAPVVKTAKLGQWLRWKLLGATLDLQLSRITPKGTKENEQTTKPHTHLYTGLQALSGSDQS